MEQKPSVTHKSLVLGNLTYAIRENYTVLNWIENGEIPATEDTKKAVQNSLKELCTTLYNLIDD